MMDFAFVGVWMFMWVFMMGFGLLAFAFWLYTLIDCVRRDFPNDTDKIIWVLVIALLNWIGSLVYYFVVMRARKTRRHR